MKKSFWLILTTALIAGCAPNAQWPTYQIVDVIGTCVIEAAFLFFVGFFFCVAADSAAEDRIRKQAVARGFGTYDTQGRFHWVVNGRIEGQE